MKRCRQQAACQLLSDVPSSFSPHWLHQISCLHWVWTSHPPSSCRLTVLTLVTLNLKWHLRLCYRVYACSLCSYHLVVWLCIDFFLKQSNDAMYGVCSSMSIRSPSSAAQDQLKLSCVSQLSGHVSAATRLADMFPNSAVIKHFPETHWGTLTWSLSLSLQESSWDLLWKKTISLLLTLRLLPPPSSHILPLTPPRLSHHSLPYPLNSPPSPSHLHHLPPPSPHHSLLLFLELAL